MSLDMPRSHRKEFIVDNEWDIHRLRREKNVWRGIAIGLASGLVLVLAVGLIGGVFLAKRSQLEAMRAEEAVLRAVQELDRAEAAKEAAEQKRKQP
jgi:hypothetical protein